MAAGDLTASTPILCQGSAAVKTALDTLNLTLVTDIAWTIAVPGRSNCWIVFKVERAAA